MKHLNRLTLLGAMIVGTVLSGQESVGTVRGSVTDPSGKPITGALVSLAGEALLGGRIVTTDDKGEYRLPLLLPGSYQLNVTKANFIGSKALFSLAAGQTLRQDLRLRPVETTGAVVEVTSTSAALDKTDTKTATTLTFDELQTLPMGGSINALGALTIAPGVTGTTDYAVIRGGIAGSAQYTINGIVVRDPATGQGSSSAWILDDLIEDIAIIQSPVNAKYGHTSAGIVNVVTKTGSNNFSGSIRARLSRADWSAYPNTAGNRFNSPMSGSTNGSPYALTPSTVNSDDMSKTWEISILGPIIKDRLTFSYGKRITPSRTLINNYGPPTNLLGSNPTNYRTYIPATVGTTALTGNPLAAYSWGVNSATPTISTQIDGPATDDFNQYKLFWQIGPTQQLEFGYSRNTYIQQRYDNATSTSNPGVDPTISGDQPATRDLSQVNYRGSLGSNAMLEINYGKRKSSISFPTGPLDPLYIRTYTNLATNLNTTASANTALFQGMGADATRTPQERSAETIKANVQIFLDKHQIDVGLDILAERQLDNAATGINNQAWYAPARLANGDYMVFNYVGHSFGTASASTIATMTNGNAYIPELRTWDTIGPSVSNLARASALYVNDLYKFNDRLDFNVGLRLEKWTLDDRQGSRLRSQDFSPRLMAQWDVRGDNRHLLTLSAAQYRGTLNQATLGQFIYYSGNVSRRYFWNQGTTTPYAVSPAQFFDKSNYGYYARFSNVSDYRQIDPNLKPEKTREVELRYRRALENGAWVRLSAVYRRTTDMMLAAGYDTKVDMNDPSGAVSAVPSSALLRIAQPDPIAFREYKGVETEWHIPVATETAWKLTFGGNWTYAKLAGRDDYSTAGAFQYYDATSRSGVPLDVYNPYGELAGSKRNMVKTWFTFEHGTPKGIRNTFTLLGKYESGDPEGNLTRTYNYPTGAFTSGASDIPTTFTGYLNGRGQRKGQDYVACDLTWALTIPIKGKLQFFSMLVVSQVFNSQIPAGGTNYGTTSPSTTPTWPGTATTNNVILGQSTMQEWGTPTGWNGVRSIATWHLGLKF